jgi:hypothetical protein
MPIVLESRTERTGDGWREVRYVYSGIDVDQIDSTRTTTANGIAEVFPRYFWSSIGGVRYRALAHIVCRFTELQP